MINCWFSHPQLLCVSIDLFLYAMLCRSEIHSSSWVYCALCRPRLQMAKSRWIQQWRHQRPKAACRHPKVVVVRLLSDRLLLTGNSEVVSKLLLITQNQSGMWRCQCQPHQGSRFVLSSSSNKSFFARWPLLGNWEKTKMLENLTAVGECLDIDEESGKSRGKCCHRELSNCWTYVCAMRVFSSIVHTHTTWVTTTWVFVPCRGENNSGRSAMKSWKCHEFHNAESKK